MPISIELAQISWMFSKLLAMRSTSVLISVKAAALSYAPSERVSVLEKIMEMIAPRYMVITR